MYSSLKEFLLETFRDYETNREILENKWRKNWTAYKTIPGLELDQRTGMGNKNSEEDSKDWRSKTVADITRVKVTAGSILVSDVLLANGEIPLMLKENKHIGDVIGSVMTSFGLTDESQDMGGTGDVSRVNENVLRMTKLVQEQMKRGGAEKALRQAILSAAIYGEGISRAVSDTFRFQSYETFGNGEWIQKTIEDDGLRMEPVSVWDFFTELENHDIQRNAGLFQRTMMSRLDVLEKFQNDPLVQKEKLERIKRRREENGSSYGASLNNESPAAQLVNRRKKDLKVLEFWGRAPESLVRNAEAETQNGGLLSFPSYLEDRQCEIMAVVVDDELIKFARVEEMSRPYFRVWWEEGVDDISGQSVADNVSVMQESLNSFMRAFEDNKKLSSNVILAMKRSMIERESDEGKLVPGKIFYLDESARNASEAIQAITIPDTGSTLRDGIALYEERGNNNSMIPEIAYGIAPAGDATATEVQTRNEKAGKYISDIVKGFDANWIEPAGKFFYNWNMLDERVPESFKGAYDVQALGFHSYQDKILRMNRIRDMLNMALSTPDLLQKLNLNALLTEWMKANELDPDTFLLSEGSEEDPRFNALVQQTEERLQAMEQTIQQVINELPSLSKASELEAERENAEIRKIEAETEKIKGETLNAVDKARNERAKVIADIEKNARDKADEQG